MITFIVNNNDSPISFNAGGDSISFSVNDGIVNIGTSNIIEGTAGAAIGGHRAVISSAGKIYYADQANLDHVNRILGITLNAAENNAKIKIQNYGELVETSFNFTPDMPVFVGTNGVLTQIIPSSGFIQQIAIALSSTKIFIENKSPIIIS
jgi:hypothetical protein